MELEAGVTSVENLDVEVLEQAAVQDGWSVFVLPDSIETRADFFAAVRERLPLDPPLVSDRSWDALADSLWEGVHEALSARILIVWPGSGKLRASAIADYETAVSIFSDLAAAGATNKPVAIILA